MTIAELLATIIWLPPERRAADVLLNGSAATFAEFAPNGDLLIKLDAAAYAAPPQEPPGVTSTAAGVKAYAEGVNAGMTAARPNQDAAIGALYGFRNGGLSLTEALAAIGADTNLKPVAPGGQRTPGAAPFACVNGLCDCMVFDCAPALARHYQTLAYDTATANPSGPDYTMAAAAFGDAAREWARCNEWMAAAHCHRMAGLALAGQAAWEGYLADPKTLTRLPVDE